MNAFKIIRLFLFIIGANLIISCGGAGISGTPETTVQVGESYSFTPSTTGLQSPLTFSVQNKPAWLNFNAINGELSGSPQESDVGTHTNITISVTAIPDGESSEKTFSLPVFSITVSSGAGNGSVSISALQQAGTAPLHVFFNSELSNINQLIKEYRWDINNDGTIDQVLYKGGSFNYTFNTVGEHEIKLYAVDRLDNIYESNALSVTVEPYDSSIDKGIRFLADDLSVSVNEPISFLIMLPSFDISRIQLDLDGNNEYEVQLNQIPGIGVIPSTSRSFSNPGSYAPRARVWLSSDLSIDLELEGGNIVVYGSETPSIDIVDSEANKIETHATLVSLSTPLQLGTELNLPATTSVSNISWFLDDQSEPIAAGESITISFPVFKDYKLSVVATLDNGSIVTDSIFIKSMEWYTFEFNSNSFGYIDHAINATSASFNLLAQVNNEYRVSIVDKNNSVIRTLEPWSTPSSNIPFSREYTWDGTNSAGEQVANGAYFVVVDYKNNQTEYRYEPFNLGGFSDNSLSSSESLNINFPSTFAPFHNDPLEISFNLDEPFEIVGFAGLNESGLQIKGFTNGTFFPAGEHKIYWAGTDDNGQFVPISPGDQRLIALWKNARPNFTIVVNEDPKIGKVTTAPNIFNPPLDRTSRIVTSSDRRCSIEVRIAHADTGRHIRTIVVNDVGPGEISIQWDGRDESNTLVQHGNYSFTVTASTENGKSIFGSALQRVYY